METLGSYLVLSGHLSPGESLLLQKVLTSNLSINQARKYLRKAGFPNSTNIVEGLQVKKLIALQDGTLFANWKGVDNFAALILPRLSTMIHEAIELKNMAEKEAEAPMPTESRSFALRIEEFLSGFAANKPTLSENKLLQKLPPLETIDIIEQLSEVGAIKIQKKKRSRSITLTAEGAALRFLFLTTARNRANYEYLERSFLAPKETSWEDFKEKIKTPEDREEIPGSLRFLTRLFTELGIFESTEDNELHFTPSSGPSPFDDPSEFENWVSGFIPVYLSNLFQVLTVLPADTATIQQETELGSSSVSGIASMLAKFKLARKDKTVWRPTKKGKALAKSSTEEFPSAFKQEIRDYPFFAEVLKFVQQYPEDQNPDNQIGFMDLAGYFRANGVTNFNPAKSLAILRIMEQADLGLVAVEEEGATGMYQLAKDMH